MRHGLFFHGVRNRLAKLGLDFMPYYWVLEGDEPLDPPKIRDDVSKYTTSYFGEEELTYIQNSIIGIAHKNLVEDYRNGQVCVGLKCGEEIAAYMLIQRNDVVFRGATIKLGENEAYLKGMYTFENYRGKGLAPYLRYECYQLVKEKFGTVKNYSISEYFNKPTLKFKRKLKAKNLELRMSMVLFKRLKRNFLLKKCA